MKNVLAVLMGLFFMVAGLVSVRAFPPSLTPVEVQLVGAFSGVSNDGSIWCVVCFDYRSLGSTAASCAEIQYSEDGSWSVVNPLIEGVPDGQATVMLPNTGGEWRRETIVWYGVNATGGLKHDFALMVLGAIPITFGDIAVDFRPQTESSL